MGRSTLWETRKLVSPDGTFSLFIPPGVSDGEALDVVKSQRGRCKIIHLWFQGHSETDMAARVYRNLDGEVQAVTCVMFREHRPDKWDSSCW